MVGFVEVGKLADLCLWCPAFFGGEVETGAETVDDYLRRDGDPICVRELMIMRIPIFSFMLSRL